MYMVALISLVAAQAANLSPVAAHPTDGTVAAMTWSKVVQHEELLLVWTDASVAVVNPCAAGARSAVVLSGPCAAADWSPAKNSIAFTERSGTISICDLVWANVVENKHSQKTQTLDLLKDEGDPGILRRPHCLEDFSQLTFVFA